LWYYCINIFVTLYFALLQVQTGRQKKRPVPKREKDLVMKALKEREFLVKQI